VTNVTVLFATLNCHPELGHHNNYWQPDHRASSAATPSVRVSSSSVNCYSIDWIPSQSAWSGYAEFLQRHPLWTRQMPTAVRLCPNKSAYRFRVSKEYRVIWYSSPRDMSSSTESLLQLSKRIGIYSLYLVANCSSWIWDYGFGEMRLLRDRIERQRWILSMKRNARCKVLIALLKEGSNDSKTKWPEAWELSNERWDSVTTVQIPQRDATLLGIQLWPLRQSCRELNIR